MINKKKYHIAEQIHKTSKEMLIVHLCGRRERRRLVKTQLAYDHRGICKQCLKATNK